MRFEGVIKGGKGFFCCCGEGLGIIKLDLRGVVFCSFKDGFVGVGLVVVDEELVFCGEIVVIVVVLK